MCCVLWHFFSRVCVYDWVAHWAKTRRMFDHARSRIRVSDSESYPPSEPYFKMKPVNTHTHTHKIWRKICFSKYNDAIPPAFKIINSFNDASFMRESANQIKLLTEKATPAHTAKVKKNNWIKGNEEKERHTRKLCERIMPSMRNGKRYGTMLYM